VDSLHSMWSWDAETRARKQSVNRMTKGVASLVVTRELERSQLFWTGKETHSDLSKKSTKNPEVSLAERARQEVLNQLNLEELAGSDRNAKAAKDNKAKAPTYMWERWTLPHCNVVCQRRGEPVQYLADWRKSFSLLRLAMVRFWKRSLLRGFVRCRQSDNRPLPLADHDLEASRDCFSQIGVCSVWAWEGGSRPSFGIGRKNFTRN
jgi:hypothetical protein